MTAPKMVTRAMLFSTILLFLVSIAVSTPTPYSSTTNDNGFVGLEIHKPAHNGTSGHNSTKGPPSQPAHCCCHICCITKKCHSASLTYYPYSEYNVTSGGKSFSGGYRPLDYKGAGNGSPARSTASRASYAAELIVALLVAVFIVVFGA